VKKVGVLPLHEASTGCMFFRNQVLDVFDLRVPSIREERQLAK
jgi:hypothetical protein